MVLDLFVEQKLVHLDHKWVVRGTQPNLVADLGISTGFHEQFHQLLACIRRCDKERRRCMLQGCACHTTDCADSVRGGTN